MVQVGVRGKEWPDSVQEDFEVRMCHEFALSIHMFPLDFQDIATIVLALPAKTVAKVAPFAFQQKRY
ncbi:hypothetical protein ATN79_20485 [Paraburkholderia caribensis]|nr:hypothetical protein ATN79_20485 [Paraburkholderia caribensis]